MAHLILQLARLGRISFRNIKQKRDYLLKRKSASWLYMSRLAAFREYSYMQTLHTHGLPIPTPIDWSRHCVLMSLAEGCNLSKVETIDEPALLYDELMGIILKFASFGLIHW
jgi:RIO kinase 2